MKDRSLPIIALAVVFLHCALVAFGLFYQPAMPVHQPKPRLVAMTIALNESQPVPAAVPPKAAPVEQAAPEPVAPPQPAPPVLPPPPKPEPVKKAEVKKKEEKPKEKPKVAESKPKPKPKPKPEAPKQPPSPPANPKKNELLAKAQESIAKIQLARDKISGGKSALKLPVVESTAGAAAGEVGYRDELAAHLRLQLKLPEYGDVRLKLTVDSSGHYVRMEILKEESLANRKYVEKTMPTLTFPPFGSKFGPKREETFTITLSNEI